MLKSRAGSLTGIINRRGLQRVEPENDKHIVRQYSAESPPGKKECGYDPLRQFGMEKAPIDTPVIGIVSRFAAQKGLT